MHTLIPPEIQHDQFYFSLVAYASRADLKTFLEIGSSSGAGSTHAFVSALRARTDRDAVRLFCMELSRVRYAALSEFYRQDAFVRCFNLSSVLSAEFPSIAEVTHFYTHFRTNLNRYPLEQVLGWRVADIAYLTESACDADGIQAIRREEGIDEFDMVLIDGSEFTGERELRKVMGAKVIALDDVNTFKCFNAYRMLSGHAGYALVRQNLELRNGFAIFERRY